MSTADVPSPWQRRPSAPPKLPDYEHPPLVQVSLVVWFLERIEIASHHIQQLQTELSPDWSLDQDRGVLKWQTRLGDQEILLNAGSLRYSWNGLGGDRYPHYPQVREGFIAVWNALCRTHAARISVERWFVEYQNRIPQGTVWTTLTDCTFLKWMSPFVPVEGLPPPDAVEAQWQFPLDQFRSHLNVSVGSSPRDEDGLADAEQPFIHLQLSCNGLMTNPDDTFLAGFDYGREVIVRTFRQLMLPAANAYWGLKT